MTASKLLLLLSIPTSTPVATAALAFRIPPPPSSPGTPPRSPRGRRGRAAGTTATTTTTALPVEGEGEGAFSSGLRSLLPTAKKRTLKLDKFGRRIHDLTDDGTAKFRKEVARGTSPLNGPATTAAAATSQDEGETKGAKASAADASSADFGRGMDASSDLSKMLSEEAKSAKALAADASSADFSRGVDASSDLSKMLSEPTEGEGAKGAKQRAADASSADFAEGVRASSDLKALLPAQKMRFMKLDKFGRRIQRMEDDGTVNVRKAPGRRPEESPVEPEASVEEAESDRKGGVPTSPSLARLLGREDGTPNDSRRISGDAVLEEGTRGVDLKELLPRRKMRFMKLDKFGRRVQRMEDDGTVNVRKVPGKKATGAKIASHRGTKEGFGSDGGAAVEADPEDAPNYGSLKDLLPTRPVWTKLDFYGRPVEDERRTKKPATVAEADVGNVLSGSGLKELLPKRAMWTKLDFHGASVEDERRTRKAESSGAADFDRGTYSNLKALLPERKVKWRKQGELLNSGSATAVGEVRGLKEERRRAMREEVIAAAEAATPAEGRDASEPSGTEAQGETTATYANLKDLLPERKISWRKTGELLSSGSAVVVSDSVRGLREERRGAGGGSEEVGIEEYLANDAGI